MSPNQEVAPQEKKDSEEVVPEVVVEKKVEHEVSPEMAEKVVESVQGSEETATASVVNDDDQEASIPVAVKTEEQKKVESILSDGLADLYTKLPDNRKDEFKQKGEETASQIVILMQATKVKFGKVVDLIKGWLSMIPGVNKFFLEQESKIKADRLIEYKNDMEEKL